MQDIKTEKVSKHEAMTRFLSSHVARFNAFLTMYAYLVCTFTMSLPKSWRDFKATIGTAYSHFGFLPADSGQTIEDIPRYAVIIGVIAIVAGLCQKILFSMKVGETSATVNASLDKGIAGIDTLVDWLDEIALVLMAVVVLLLVLYIQSVVDQRSSGGGPM